MWWSETNTAHSTCKAKCKAIPIQVWTGP